MSTAAAPLRPRNDTIPSTAGLTFSRLVRSEWIKLWSLRSTVWCFVILAAVTIASIVIPALVIGSGQPNSTTAVDQLVVQLGTVNVTFTALVIAVLGVLTISGEYGTGMIRTTFTVDPRRFGVLSAKALVLGLATFVVSAVSTWLGLLLATPLLAGHGVHAHLGHAAVFMPVLGGSVYVTMVALLAFGIGLLVRASAGGITITLVVLLVLPTVISIIAGIGRLQWLDGVVSFLPAQAGAELYTYAVTSSPVPGEVTLNGWEGFLVLLAEVVVVGALGFTAARRRDV